jgi:DNA-binding Lrp family transcriptional regulator
MDAIDRRLIALLREDASRPLKALAGAVSLSASSVRERIQRLVARGEIVRFTIETPPPPRGCAAILLIRLRSTPDPVVVGAIKARGDVLRCYSLSGPIDLLVEVSAASVAEINRARDEIAGLAGVADVETSFVLKADKVAVGC